jgi:nucleoside-diphosphate-sugar epimerase
MNIVITGGSGKAGRGVVAELREHGHDVLVVDKIKPADTSIRFLSADLTDYGQVVDALTGADAVAHLAAIPAPRLFADAVTFRNNMVSDYNIFLAARQVGIKNVVWASSETVLGLPFDTPPPYVPLDEEYPGRPESAYSLAKHLTEKMAEQFCRWDPDLKIFGLRFSNVMEPHDYARFPSFDADPNSRRWNLWCYIDVRDAAQAVRLALESSLRGAEVFVIANSDSVMSQSSADLMAECFPGVPFQRDVGPQEALMSSNKAKQLLGFEPKHSWREELRKGGS